MARFEVVAVYPSGRRYAVRAQHESLGRALWHRELCERDADSLDTWTYEVDVYYVGADGQNHWRGNVTADDLGYTAEEVDSYRWDCA